MRRILPPRTVLCYVKVKGNARKYPNIARFSVCTIISVLYYRVQKNLPNAQSELSSQIPTFLRISTLSDDANTRTLKGPVPPHSHAPTKAYYLSESYDQI